MSFRRHQLAALLAAAVVRHEKTVRARLPKALAGEEAAVHRARVATRRLREVLGVLELAGAPKRAHRLRRELRRMTRALGPVREIDVAIAELERAGTALGWSADRLAALHRLLGLERDKRRARMMRKLAGVDADRLKSRAARVAEDVRASPSEARLARALRAHVSERADRAAEAIRACGTMYAPERLHDLRIAVKKLRYALEFEADAEGTGRAEAVLLLRRTQRRLGHLHDIQILASQIDAAGTRGHGVAAHAAAAVGDLERACREIHGRVVRDLDALEVSVSAVRRGAGASARGERLQMAHSRLDPRGRDARSA